MWNARVLTLFPEMFPGPLGASLASKAREKNIWSLDVFDIRDYAKDKHKSVDDAPFGGGAGMVMRADVVADALAAARQNTPENIPAIYFSPRGRLLDQSMVREFAAAPGAIMLCGRYEGLDQRVIDKTGLLEVSIGDFVLAGGEIAALAMMDAVVRLLPGVLGNEESNRFESFENNLLEHPLYTRPDEWEGMRVPEVLTSGNHKAIADWRKAQSEAITRERRPDLWNALKKNKK